ncbi:MAG: chloride channel protein [Fervidobacterium sp.]
MFTRSFDFALLFLKFSFTLISYTSDTPGGIFLPILSIGATIGMSFFEVFTYFIPSLSPFWHSFIILGILGSFSAVVKAPLTGIILVIEMVQMVPIFLGSTLVSILSYTLTEIVGTESIYDILLEKITQR